MLNAGSANTSTGGAVIHFIGAIKRGIAYHHSWLENVFIGKHAGIANTTTGTGDSDTKGESQYAYRSECRSSLHKGKAKYLYW